jgi:hypothetical protein
MPAQLIVFTKSSSRQETRQTVCYVHTETVGSAGNAAPPTREMRGTSFSRYTDKYYYGFLPCSSNPLAGAVAVT